MFYDVYTTYLDLYAFSFICRFFFFVHCFIACTALCQLCCFIQCFINKFEFEFEFEYTQLFKNCIVLHCIVQRFTVIASLRVGLV